MEDETLFTFEESGSRQAVAASLRAITAQLSGSGPISLTAGDESIAVHPSETINFEIEIEREEDDGEGHLELEVELGWSEEARSDGPGDTGSAGRTESSPAADAQPGADADVVDLESVQAPGEPEEGVAEAVGSLGTFEVFEDRAGEWRWRLVHRNGNVIATSGEGYTRRRNAEKGLRSVVENAPGADVIDGL